MNNKQANTIEEDAQAMRMIREIRKLSPGAANNSINIRTNLRTSRADTTYVITVSLQGTQTTKPYIYASFIASTTTEYFTSIVAKRAAELGEINETLKVYTIAYDPAHGITNPTSATQEAIRRYQAELTN